MALSDKQGKRVFGLEIDGLAYRWYSNKNPLPNPSNNDLSRIVNISSFNSNLPELAGGIGKYDAITITLLSKFKGSSGEPVKVLTSNHRTPNIYKAVLQTEIKRNEATPTLVVDIEPVSLSFPCNLFIGSETFIASGYTGSGDLWEITTTGRSGPRQYHQIRLDGTDAPFVSDRVLNFRGRFCKLYMGYWDFATDTITETTVLVNGFIERSPELGEGGSISLSILPKIAMLDNSLTSGSQSQSTYLARGGHYFEAYKRRYFLLSDVVDNDPEILTPRNISSVCINETFATSNHWMTTTEIKEIINFFGRLNPCKITLSSRGGENFLSTTHTGYEAVVGDIQRGSLFTESLKLLDDYRIEKGVAPLSIWNYNLNGVLVEVRLGLDDGLLFNPALNLSSSSQPLKQEDKNKDTPLVNPDFRSLYMLESPPSDAINPLIPVAGLADAFYLPGESWICVENSIGLPSSSTAGQSYQVSLKQGEVTYFLKLTHEEDIGNGRVLLHLDTTDLETRNLPPLRQYPNETPIEITPALSLSSSPASIAMLNILMSGGGEGLNGSYDTMQVGLNLTSSDVNLDSFLSMALSSDLPFAYQGSLEDDLTVGEILNPLLICMGAVLVMYDGKITLKSIQEPSLSLMTITDDDMFLEPPPASSIREDIVTQFNVEWDFDRNRDPKKAIFNNYAALNAINGEGKKMDISLYGLTPNDVGFGNDSIYAYLKPTISRLFNLYGSPVMQYTFSVYAGRGYGLEIGKTIEVNSSRLLGYDGEYGVLVPCIIVGLNKSVFEEGVELTVISYGVNNYCLYNAAAHVLALTSSNQLSFRLTDFSSNDLQYFNAGDSVFIVNKFSNARVSLTIDFIVGNLVTFKTNTGIVSTNSIMIPADFSSGASASALSLGGFTDIEKEFL